MQMAPMAERRRGREGIIFPPWANNDTMQRGGLPIFVESPRDPILLEAGAFAAEL